MSEKRAMKEKLKSFVPREVKDLSALPLGDLPGGYTTIDPAQVGCAITVFDKVKGIILDSNKEERRIVLSVYGGSGAGKTGMAALLRDFFEQAGIGAYVLSGDNYPKRIPKYNDAERIQIYQNAGLKALLRTGEYTKERAKQLLDLQMEGTDANEELFSTYPWLFIYQNAGRAALKKYLGTPKELAFQQLNQALMEFKEGAGNLWLRRMGRKESEVWYEKVDVSKVEVLILEWTHGNSKYLEGVDVPIFLSSTPKETLSDRLKRARDVGADSVFVNMVLTIEQNLLEKQAKHAKIIFLKEGRSVTYKEYKKSRKEGGLYGEE